jgi:signal transduction histidine kinase/ActR/RegA family two-component response regulator
MDAMRQSAGTPLPDAYLGAWERMTEVLLTERDAPTILRAFACIAGETLGTDRSLIYEVRLDDQVAAALVEWLNPNVDVTPTQASYPLSAFGRGDAEMRRTRSHLESHIDGPHPELVADGSSTFLHADMSIKSLLWYPFDFRTNGYYLLIFNQVTHRRDWTSQELEFLRMATRQVRLALLQIAWHEERERTQRLMLETQQAESIRLLAGGVAHDFNSLLGIVLGAVGRARASLNPENPNVAALRDAERAALEASDLARHLLHFSGRGPGVARALDLELLVTEMQDLLRAAAAHVPVHFATHRPAWISGDPGQIRQILMNLVVNAKDASEGRDAPSIHVSVTAKQAPEPRALLTGRATGAGLAADVRARIFDPFYTTKAAGRGLGLAAVSGIVAAHGAGLTVESELGAGSTFVVSFPRVLAPVDPRQAGARPLIGAGRTLLVVDDHDNFRLTCVKLLSDLGFRTMDAGSGAQALVLLDAPEAALIAGVLVDWSMPGSSGVELLRRLRDRRTELPIMVMSGAADGGVQDTVKRLGCRFIEKPFSLRELEDTLVAALGPASTPEPPQAL